MKAILSHWRAFIVLMLVCCAGAGLFVARGRVRSVLSRIKTALLDHRDPSTLAKIDPESLKSTIPETTPTIVRRGSGKTYCVAPSGNDANPGTLESPFLTLQRAADAVLAGDTVIVRPGSYGAGMNLVRRPGGAADNPICFLADPGVTITHCAVSGTNASTAAINLESCGGYYSLQGFKIVGDGSMQKAGIRVALTNHVQILNNTIDHAFTGVFVSSSDNALVQGNICFDSTDEHGIYMSNTHDYVVRGNILSGNNWDGLHLNMLAGSAGSINSGGLIENNLIRANNLSGIDMEATTKCVFRNNLIYANTKHGITIHYLDQDSTPPCTGDMFVNNTIVGNGMSAIQMAGAGNASNTFFNNILLASSGTYGSLCISGDPAGLISDHNIVTDSFSIDLAKNSLTLSRWQSRTGQDLHSVIAAPDSLFVAVSHDDFHLLPASPAVNAGVASVSGHDAPTRDLDGMPRPNQGNVDVGAYEWHKPRTPSNVSASSR